MSEEIKSAEESVEVKSTRGRKPVEKKEYSVDEIQALINSAVAQALAAQKPTVVMQSNEEMVTLLYMGACAEKCMVHLHDEIGEIAGQGGTLDVPKKVFLRYRTTTPILNRLNDRRLLVIDGLTDDERERYGLTYKDGEVVDEKIYKGLLDMNEPQILDIFKKACFRHKQLIAALIIDAYSDHDNRINQGLIQNLNKASLKEDKDGMFTAILKDMAKALTDTEADDE